MRMIIYTDERGYRHRVYLRDKDGDEMAAFGIPYDPPDVDELDCEFLKREIHNALVENGLFTWTDVQKSSVGLNAVVTVVKRQLSGLYQEKQRQDKQRENSQIL